jgi:hypothetical protein
MPPISSKRLLGGLAGSDVAGGPAHWVIPIKQIQSSKLVQISENRGLTIALACHPMDGHLFGSIYSPNARAAGTNINTLQT